MLIGFLLGAVIGLVLLWAWHQDVMAETVLTIIVASAVVSCNQSTYWQESEKARDAAHAAQYRADATPHVIREVDGCKVYAFKAADYWHYFTRCGDNTVTEGHHGETTGSGKTRRTVDVAETIPAENK